MPAQVTPFIIGYALHDAVVRALPGVRMGSALAESWSESPDGLTYEFKLRSGLKFHNGDPCTAEDVQFSFRRYKGSGANEFQAKVKNVEVVDARTASRSIAHLAGFHDILWQQRDRRWPGSAQNIWSRSVRRVLRSTPLAWDRISLSAIHQRSNWCSKRWGYWRKCPTSNA